MYWLHFCCCDKIPDKNNLRERGFILLYRCRGMSPSLYGWHGNKQGGHGSSTRKLAERIAAALRKQSKNRKWGPALSNASSPPSVTYIFLQGSTSYRFYGTSQIVLPVVIVKHMSLWGSFHIQTITMLIVKGEMGDILMTSMWLYYSVCAVYH